MTKITIAGIPMQVVPESQVINNQTPLICVRMSKALKPLSVMYVPGTKGGYYCSVCSEEVILAPSGQEIERHKRNKLICMECIIQSLGKSA